MRRCRGSCRPFLLAVTVLLGAACATAPTVPPGAVIAVWDLDDLSRTQGGGADLGELLAGQVIETVQAKGYTVVERQRLLLLLEELRVGSSSLADDSTRLRLGRLTGARFMVFGGYQIYGGEVRIDLRLVEVESGRVLKASKRVSASSAADQMTAARSAAADLLPSF